MSIVNTKDRKLENFINNELYVFNVDGEFICKCAINDKIIWSDEKCPKDLWKTLT